MKIITYVLGAMLVAAMAAGAIFYFMTYEPMQLDYARMKAGMPELEKARGELKKYKTQEIKTSQEAAWINPILESLNTGFSEEIQAGKAEVAAVPNGIVVNIAEDILYTPGSVTFRADSKPLLLRIAGLLANKDLKAREITVGHATNPVPAQVRGRKKVPPREARDLGADRALALTKFLEQNKVSAASLIAAGYPEKTADTGFKIKSNKTMIRISNPPSPLAAATEPAPAEEKPEPPTAEPQPVQPAQ